MRSPKAILDLAINILSGLLGLVVLALLMAHYFLPKTGIVAQQDSLQAGKRVPLAGENWAKYHQSLVMALQVGCEWCEASAPFYQELLRSDVGNTFHPVAVLPQPVDQSKKFLQSFSIRVTDIRQADLRKIGVGGTPTLILVDTRGRIESSWIGQLSPALEDEVFTKLGIHRNPVQSGSKEPMSRDRSGENGLSLITGAQFVALRKAQPEIPIIDVDPRDNFEMLHIAGSLNIPIGELEVRARHEIPPGYPIVLYCGFRPSCQPASMSEHLQTFSFVGEPIQSYCGLGELDLQLLGFKRLLVLSDDLMTLGQTGVRLVANPHVEGPSATSVLSSKVD